MKKLAKSKPAPVKDGIELRRWCIESALRWPMEGPFGGGNQLGYQQMPMRHDVDVIGRANKLLKWVTQPQ